MPRPSSSTHIAPTAVARMRTTLSALFTYAMREKYIAWTVTAPRKRPHMPRHYCASQWLRAGNGL